MHKLKYEVEVVHKGRDLIGESPMWHPVEQRLYWVDTRRPALQRLEPNGEVRIWPMPNNIGSYVFRRSRGIVAGLKQGFSAIDLDSGEIELIVDPEPHLGENRLNDGRCDRRGRYWCGSRDPGNTNPSGSLYRLDSDLSCHQMDSGFIVSNCMAFSPDDKTLVFGDSSGETVWKYDLDLDSGEIHNKRLYLSTRGLPWRIDGATFDADGYYWCALIGDSSIARFDPDGRLDRLVRLPVSHPTMCNFGGPELDVLYVTSAGALLTDEQLARQPLAGALFAVRGLNIRGVAEPLFGA